MRKYARLAVAIVLALAATAAIALFSVYRAARSVPEFYQRALSAKPEEQKEAGQKFEQQALELHNQARRAGRWEARFTEDQINGWLAAELPVKFPKLLPGGIADPRVAIDKSAVQLALRYDKGGTQTVVTLSGQVQLTAEPNELAVRIDAVRAGLVPLPFARFRDEIAERAAKAGYPLHWTEVDGTPVALLRLPLDERQFKGRRLIVEELALNSGELVVAGRTEMPSEKTEPPVEASVEPVQAAAPPKPDIEQR